MRFASHLFYIHSYLSHRLIIILNRGKFTQIWIVIMPIVAVVCLLLFIIISFVLLFILISHTEILFLFRHYWQTLLADSWLCFHIIERYSFIHREIFILNSGKLIQIWIVIILSCYCFGTKSIWKVWLQSKFGWILQDSVRIFWLIIYQ